MATPTDHKSLKQARRSSLSATAAYHAVHLLVGEQVEYLYHFIVAPD